MAAQEIRLKFNKRRIAGFTGNQLKLIAFLFMLCDSIGSMLIENGMLYAQNPAYWTLAIETEEGRRLYLIARILRAAGRIAFPIFAFLISEGVVHTRNTRNYILRLLIFAFVSEVPFDLATRELIYYPDYQNILFTYALGAMSVACMKKISGTKQVRLHLFVQILTTGVLCLAAYLIKSDYGAVGVLMISLFYILREGRMAKLISGACLAAAESVEYACVSAIAFVFIYFYNGKRGDIPLKYFFYLAYPAHLMLFWALVYFANR